MQVKLVVRLAPDGDKEKRKVSGSPLSISGGRPTGCGSSPLALVVFMIQLR